jgi:hypothetical protein
MTRVTGKQQHDETVRAYRLSQPCPVVCAYCGQRFEGTLAETRAQYHTHRYTQHSELPAPRKRIKTRVGSWQIGVKHIDDNIAAARKVGAGRNAA